MKKDFAAYIFDLDGVLTQTQDLHARAWEKMFNEFLAQRRKSQKNDEDLASFRVPSDYRKYLDGKPRYDGVRSFLSSRKIQLPSGNESEGENYHTITGLGLTKDKYYQDLLKREGPGVIFDSLTFLHKLKEHSVPMAVVSSSKNCRMILEQTGMDGLFSSIIDPDLADAKKLRGKPEPDYFIEAAKVLRTAPENCIMVEDALSGIEAGKKGKFGRVVGIRVNGDKQGMDELKSAGADEVVSSLWDIEEAVDLLKIPHALTSLDQILSESRNYFLFLDFDGTISAIAPEPSEAKPLEGITDIIRSLAFKMPVCIITGRDTEVIKGLINLPQVYYAACHGFEITGPGHYHYDLQEARAVIPELDRAQRELMREFEGEQGLIIERKKFGLAIHYRMVHDREKVPSLLARVENYSKSHRKLKAKPGEEVLELIPAIDWNKGRALQKLYEVLQISQDQIFPLYFGDGKTDEDAFAVIAEKGIPVLISPERRPTFARYYLEDPLQTKKFLELLDSKLESKHDGMDSRI